VTSPFIKAKFKETVMSIQIKKDDGDYKIIGSGFLFSTASKKLKVVTCKHVVKLALAKKKTIYCGAPTEEGYRRVIGEPAYIDKKEDFAILSLKPNPDINIHMLKRYVTLKNFGSDALIVEGKGVLIIGYPLGLGVEHDFEFPVIKLGIVSGFTKKNWFLIDANVNPGNSGSPVISIRDNKIIGIITSYKLDRIELFDKNGNLVATFPYNSGLSQAITIQKIKEELMSFK